MKLVYSLYTLDFTETDGFDLDKPNRFDKLMLRFRLNEDVPTVAHLLIISLASAAIACEVCDTFFTAP